MKRIGLPAIAGFILLFFLYHAAEYMILFRNSAAGFFLIQILFFSFAWLLGQWQFGNGLGAWGLDNEKGFMKPLSIGMLMGLALYGLTFLISLSTGSERIMKFPQTKDFFTPLVLFIFGNFFSSFSEDILTRGYVFKFLEPRLPYTGIALVSALLYVLNHIYRLSSGFETISYLFLLGIFFVIPLITTRRLWLTGGAHWAGNCFFYITHEIIKTDGGNFRLSPNSILCLSILLLSPVFYRVAKNLA